MKKIAIYPGSFNPWHAGHRDVLDKALMIFDKVIVARGINPDKPLPPGTWHNLGDDKSLDQSRVQPVQFSGLLLDLAKKYKATAVIKGLRNGTDLQYEKDQQYWNEDLGIEIPTVYVICDRRWSHISSSALRALQKFKDDL